AKLGDAGGDLCRNRCPDCQLCYVDLMLVQGSRSLLDLGCRELSFLRACAGDGQLQVGLCGLSLADRGFEVAGRLIDIRLWRITRVKQLRLAVVSFLIERHISVGRCEFGPPGGDRLLPRAVDPMEIAL